MSDPFIRLGASAARLSTIKGYAVHPKEAGLCGANHERRIVVWLAFGPVLLAGPEMDAAIDDLISAGVAPESLRAEKCNPPAGGGGHE